MSEETIVRYRYDPKNPRRLTKAERARLDRMTDRQLVAAAKSDPDNPPLTADQLYRVGVAAKLRVLRAR